MKKVFLVLQILFVAGILPLAAEENQQIDTQIPSAFQDLKDYLQGPEVYQALDTTHDILGYSAAGLGIAACVFNPGFVDDDIHESIGKAALAVSISNIGIGLLNYSNRFSFNDSLFKRDNIHIAMGIAGGVCMIAANLIEADDDDTSFGSSAHSWLGMIGSGLMTSSIIIQLL
ncbi:MAG: hypothetical protein K9L21_04855 [Spirochaetia bacterium]|nr:hypothetical protein [Spirochaetia bacterium]